MQQVQDRKIKDILHQNIDNLFHNVQEDSIYPIMDSQRIDEYMTFIISYAIKISLGVSILILSSIPVLLHFINGLNLGIGIILTIIIACIAIGLFIVEGLKYTSFEDVHRSDYHLSQYDYQHLQDQFNKLKKPFAFAITLGVLLILGVSIYPLYAVFVSETFTLNWLVPLIIQTSISIFIFTSFGIIYSSYQWFLRSDLQKAFDRKVESVKEGIGTLRF